MVAEGMGIEGAMEEVLDEVGLGDDDEEKNEIQEEDQENEKSLLKSKNSVVNENAAECLDQYSANSG
jgi:hypothetical protein